MRKIFSYLSLLKKYNTLKNEYEILQKKYEIATDEVEHLISMQKALRKQLRQLRMNNRTKSKYVKKTNEVKNERS